MKLIIQAIITFLKLIITKYIRGKRIQGINRRIAFGKGSSLTIEKKGEIRFIGQFVSRRNMDMTVGKQGKIVIGDKVFFNSNCVISIHESLIIGDRVQFGPGCMLFDNDHDYRKPVEERATTFRTSPILIGENTWIGAGSIILRGTRIGTNCVIGAGSIIKGYIPDNSVVVQKRMSNIMQKED